MLTLAVFRLTLHCWREMPVILQHVNKTERKGGAKPCRGGACARVLLCVLVLRSLRSRREKRKGREEAEKKRNREKKEDARATWPLCRRTRRTGSYIFEGRGQKGVGCSCVAPIDVVRQLCAASQQAGLAATTAWRCGRSREG